MPRGSFSRTVARAAASGGGRSYKARRPLAWYSAIFIIVVVGLGLIFYSRHERTSKTTAAVVHPVAGDNWEIAFAVNICGTLQSNLAVNSNLTTVGIRTFGDGLIRVTPGALQTAAAQKPFDGANATLGKFASSYPSFTLTAKTIKLPGKAATLYRNGEKCPANSPVGAKPGELVARVWSSPTSSSHLFTNPSAIRLENKQLITLAFVPVGTKLAKPASASALSGATEGPTTTTTPKSGSSKKS